MPSRTAWQTSNLSLIVCCVLVVSDAPSLNVTFNYDAGGWAPTLSRVCERMGFDIPHCPISLLIR